jgi:hypothetical protein
MYSEALFATPGIKKTSFCDEGEKSRRLQNGYIRVAYNTESSLRYCQRRSYLVTQCHTYTSADILVHEAPASTVAPMITHRFQQAPWP